MNFQITEFIQESCEDSLRARSAPQLSIEVVDKYVRDGAVPVQLGTLVRCVEIRYLRHRSSRRLVRMLASNKAGPQRRRFALSILASRLGISQPLNV
jgi:hypothetical protein